ncbi:hypothetical protein TNCV_4733511 [Trichonephila clavipes]|nr:hypothetical protein TNCV_4733511 [Trichonephila clavipes]
MVRNDFLERSGSHRIHQKSLKLFKGYFNKTINRSILSTQRNSGLGSKTVLVLNCPALSPDLNPTENIWSCGG